MRILKRLLVLLAEIAFAVAWVIVLIWAGFHHKKVPFLLILLVLQTAGVFGYVLKMFRNQWRNSSFWMWLTVIFVVHLAGAALLVRYAEYLKVVHVGLAACIEYFAICMLLDKLLFYSSSSKGQSL